MSLAAGPEMPRYVSHKETAIEQGFMAMNRAVFKPSRIKLPEDKA